MISILKEAEAELFLEDNFLCPAHLFQQILKETPWVQNDIRIFGKTQKEPRLTMWYGPPYKYSSIQWPEAKLPQYLDVLRQQLTALLDFEFNSILLNYYRTGNDSMGWHSDNEKEIDHSMIASLSLGGTRKMQFRSKISNRKAEILLHHNSLLVMKNFQTNWQHAIPKSKTLGEPRINLTFRRIIQG